MAMTLALITTYCDHLILIMTDYKAASRCVSEARNMFGYDHSAVPENDGNGGGIPLQELANIQILQEIQDSLCAVFSLGACIYAPNGEPVTSSTSFSPLFKYFIDALETAMEQDGSSAMARWLRLSVSLDGAAVTELPFSGLYGAVLPIIVAEDLLGYWLVTDNGKGYATPERLATACQAYGLDTQDAMALWDAAPKTDTDRLQNILQLVHMFTDKVCRLLCSDIALQKEMRTLRASEDQLQKDYERQGLISSIMRTTFTDGTIEDAADFVMQYITQTMHRDTAVLVIQSIQTDSIVYAQSSPDILPFDKLSLHCALQEYNNDFERLAGQVSGALGPEVQRTATIPIKAYDEWIGFICIGNLTEADAGFDDGFCTDSLTILQNAAITIADIYIKEAMQTRLKQTNETLESILNHMNLWISVIDAETKDICFVNENAAKGIAFIRDTERNSPDHLPVAGQIFLTEPKLEFLATSMIAPLVREYYNNTYHKWFMSNTSLVKWLDGRDAVIEISVDITSEKEKEDTINTLMWYDKLTGLQSRLKMFHDLNDAINQNHAITLAIININFFRRINEVYSHEFGNKFLLEIAGFLAQFYSSECTLYHLGGDEFAFTSKFDDKVDDIVLAVKNRFDYSWQIEDVECYCSVSIGIASFPKDADQYELLVKNSNTAVRMAKERNKNMIVYFDDEEDKIMYERFHFENRLIHSVMKDIDQFIVYYQPLVDANSGKVISMEALVRWIEPELGFIRPDDFIGVAEKAGIICQIDEYVLFKACEFVRQLHAVGYGDMTVHVNLSVAQLYQGNLLDVIKNALYKSSLKAKYLTLEVTESLAMTDINLAMEVLEKIKNMNVLIALDDFGTGFSSLSNLKLLPVDTLKIDRRFVNDIRKSHYNFTFIKTIIELAHSAKIKVCCEGIEEDFQWQQLVEFRCDYLQGYYFGRPVPSSEFLKVLADNQLFFEQL